MLGIFTTVIVLVAICIAIVLFFAQWGVLAASLITGVVLTSAMKAASAFGDSYARPVERGLDLAFAERALILAFYSSLCYWAIFFIKAWIVRTEVTFPAMQFKAWCLVVGILLVYCCAENAYMKSREMKFSVNVWYDDPEASIATGIMMQLNGSSGQEAGLSLNSRETTLKPDPFFGVHNSASGYKTIYFAPKVLKVSVFDDKVTKIAGLYTIAIPEKTAQLDLELTRHRELKTYADKKLIQTDQLTKQ